MIDEKFVKNMEKTLAELAKETAILKKVKAGNAKVVKDAKKLETEGNTLKKDLSKESD